MEIRLSLRNVICILITQITLYCAESEPASTVQSLGLETSTLSNCIPPVVSGNPSCTFQVTDDANKDVSIGCLRPGVFQVIGDYKVFYINCTASYPLDFKFDGHKPTEAIHANTWGQVAKKSGGKFESFHLDLRIFSISSLYDYYRKFPGINVSPQEHYNYSRTGNYIFSGYHERENFKSQFYIFFEEPWAKKSFLRNENVTFYSPVSNLHADRPLIVPCRPSHFYEIVTLDQIENRTVEFTYDETAGFISKDSWKSILANESFHLSQPLAFTCFLGDKEQPDDFVKFPAKFPKREYGFDGLPESTDADPVYNVDVLANGSVATRRACTFYSQKVGRAVLTYQGVESPITYRLQRHLILPVFRKRSFSVTTINLTIDNGSTDLNIPKGITSLLETSLCLAGSSYVVSTMSIEVSGSSRSLPYDIDFSRAKRENYGSSYYFKISYGSDDTPNSNILYENQRVTFKCYIHTFYHVPPSIWYTVRANGTVVEEVIDYHWKKSYFSYAEILLSEDVRKVVCAASVWHTPDWRNRSMDVTLRHSGPPIFVNGPHQLQSFSLNSKNQNLKCTARGVPQPHVYWQRDSKNISSTETSDSEGRVSSILEFLIVQQVDEGEYVCIASSVAYTAEKRFTVQIYIERDLGLKIGIPAAILICVAVGVTTSIYVKYFRVQKLGLTKAEVDDFINGEARHPNLRDSSIPLGTVGKSDQYVHELTHLSPYRAEYEIPPNRFQIDTANILGSGAYGMVLMGALDGVPVAVKTVKRNADKSYLKALLSELKVMIFLGTHENIVGILGASTRNLRSGEVFIFVPFCELGNLENYLRDNRHLFVSNPGSYVNTTATNGENNRGSANYVTLKNLYDWSTQIAQGMKYLGSKKVIHGDLAARNILLTGDGIAKITDFGLSRQLCNYSEYSKKKQAPLPWRYMSLESLRDLKFSTKSDVWSYGVLLWEIFTLAQTPYPGYSWTSTFVKELENGLRMGRPQHAPENLYNIIIKECWQSEPLLRPTFEHIREFLTTNGFP